MLDSSLCAPVKRAVTAAAGCVCPECLLASLCPLAALLSLQANTTELYIPLSLSDVYNGTWNMDESGEQQRGHAHHPFAAAF